MNDHHINVAIGEAHRAKLRALIVPRLYVGARIPTAKFIARILGIDESRAGKHMRRVLVEAGIRTETRRVDTGCRVFVVGMGYNGNARQEWPDGRLKESNDAVTSSSPAVDPGEDRDLSQGRDQHTATVGQGASRGAASAGSRPSERRAAA